MNDKDIKDLSDMLIAMLKQDIRDGSVQDPRLVLTYGDNKYAKPN